MKPDRQIRTIPRKTSVSRVAIRRAVKLAIKPDIKTKDIPGQEGRYAITKCGKVWSYRARKWRNPGVNAGGYLAFTADKDYKSKVLLVHRMVLLTWVGDSPLQAFHRNGNKLDNRLENLYYREPFRVRKNRETALRRELKKRLKEEQGKLKKKLIALGIDPD